MVLELFIRMKMVYSKKYLLKFLKLTSHIYYIINILLSVFIQIY